MSTMITPPKEQLSCPSGRLPLAARRAAWDQLWRFLLASPISDAELAAAQGAEDPDKSNGKFPASCTSPEAA